MILRFFFFMFGFSKFQMKPAVKFVLPKKILEELIYNYIFHIIYFKNEIFLF